MGNKITRLLLKSFDRDVKGLELQCNLATINSEN